MCKVGVKFDWTHKGKLSIGLQYGLGGPLSTCTNANYINW